MNPATSTHIESVPGKCGGKPCIAGTRVRVWDVYVLHEQQGRSADDVIAAFPELTLADVYAALAYYYDHREEINAQAKADGELLEALRQDRGLGPLAAKLAEKNAGGSEP